LPAWIENRPARLLKALACGLPVIATAAYGLPPQAHLTLLASGDADALTAALRAFAPLSRAAETQLV
jgi:glycosyltransferase involved in cell wall biosynthesis